MTKQKSKSDNSSEGVAADPTPAVVRFKGRGDRLIGESDWVAMGSDVGDTLWDDDNGRCISVNEFDDAAMKFIKDHPAEFAVE